MYKKIWLLVTLGAICYPLAIPPFSSFWLMEVSLAFLLCFFEKIDLPKRTFLGGWFYGTLAFSIGIHWLFYSIHQYGGVNSFVAGLIVLGVAGVFGLLPALHGYIYKHFFSKFSLDIRVLLGFPLIISVFSFCHYLPFSFIGLSHINTVLRNYVPFLGEIFLVFFIAQQGAILFWFFAIKCKNLWKKFLAIVYVISIWGGGFYLEKKIVECTGEQIAVTALQTNLTPIQKWNPVLLQQHFNKYVQGSLLNSQQTELVVWPEVALPYLTGDLLQFLQGYVRDLKVSLLLGRLREEGDKIFNSASLIDQKVTNYNKYKLMPFGEYLPSYLSSLRKYFSFLPEKDMAAGLGKEVLKLYDTYPFAVNICYETLFPVLTWKKLPEAEFIVTLSDDSWFKNSWVVEQHLATAQMLSLASGRYQVFVSNGGISAFMDHRGKIIKQTKLSKALLGSIKLSKSLPISVRFYYCYCGFFLLIFLIMICWPKRQKK